METNAPALSPDPPDPAWIDRERYWRRKLGRIQLGAEPVGEQLARYRRVTWMLTAVTLGVGAMIVGLFAAFRRPDIGLILAAILFAPVLSVAWFDHLRLGRLVARYQRERATDTTASSLSP